MTSQRARPAMTSLTYQILLALSGGDRHGYAILKEMEERGGTDAVPSTGALYMALARLESEGLVREATAPPDDVDDARRRYYRITARGRDAAATESRRLADLVADARARRLLGDPVPDGGEA